MGKQKHSEAKVVRKASGGQMAAMAAPALEPEPSPAMRTAVRFPIRLEIRILTENGEILAETENISSNGLMFVSDMLPEVDSRVEFTISMPSAVMGSPKDVSVHCVGRVIRHHQMGETKKAAVVIDEYFLKA